MDFVVAVVAFALLCVVAYGVARFVRRHAHDGTG
jgi:hypothetical protein